MSYDHEKQKALDAAHLRSPLPGDYWHEMYCPIARILMVDDKRVLLQRLSGRAGTEINANDPKPVVMSRRRFQTWLSYKSIPRTWASVIPEHLKNSPQNVPKTLPRTTLERRC